MKRICTITLMSIAPCLVLAQTVYVPNGTAGIGSSTNGNVGIGTAAPSVWFQNSAFEYANYRPVLKLTSTAGNMGIGTLVFTNSSIDPTTHNGEFHVNHQFNQGNYGNSLIGFYSYPAGNLLSLYANGNISTGAGNVGIGTTNPGTKLDVNGAINVSAGGVLSPPSGLGYGLFPHANVGLGLYSVNGGISFWGGSTATEYMRITNGSVGIGTTSPTMKLHLGTSNSLDGIGLHHNNGSWANLFSPSMTGGAYNGITQPGDAGVIFGSDGGVNTVSNGFVIAPHRSTTSGLRINNNGDVGIGTASPDAKLSVKGQVHAQEVKVDLSVPGPDYVFEPAYHLSPLDSIKTYIDKNKHLPEVPSAKEMEKNGVNLGEMNMLLLKKIEELTLYVIELKKRDETQQKEIEQLKNK